jgi:hypothetical protein
MRLLKEIRFKEKSLLLVKASQFTGRREGGKDREEFEIE